MRANALSTAVPALLLVVALLLTWTWLHWDRFSAVAQRQWILQAVQELSQMLPPSPALERNTDKSGSYTWWSRPDYLIFSNGWAAYKIHTVHDGEKVGDIAVLRASDGALYYSNEHYCVGITEWMEPHPSLEAQSPAPSDLRDFLAHYGERQDWKSFAPDNRKWCVVNFSHPNGHQGRKPISVWISRGEGTNRATLLDRRYKVSGSYVSWSTSWPSNDCVVLDIYDHGPGIRPIISYPGTLLSNHLMSLSFHLNNRTGLYEEE